MRIIILDCETGVNNVGEDSVGDFKASPYSSANSIVAYGCKRLGYEGVRIITKTSYKLVDLLPPHLVGTEDYSEVMLVGHNIKFDLLHLLRTGSTAFANEVWPHVYIWDTMLAEYLITGQSSQYASLDTCALKYGGVLKDDRIKEYWDAGTKTEDIPTHLLTDYLKGDVENTEKVFVGQMEIIRKLKMIPLLRTQMAGLKATVEMEDNGMHFDRVEAMKLAEEAESEMQTTTDSMRSLLNDTNCYSPYFVQEIFNINSAEHLGTALCGGDYSYRVKVKELDAFGEVKRFKSGAKMGEVRYKHEVRNKHTKGMGVVPDPDWTTPSGKMGVGSNVLKDIAARVGVGLEVKEFCKLVLETRALNKDYKTYYVGYSNLTWADSCIHASLSHVGTDTGRLSCSKPNLQNATQVEDH